VRTQRENFTGVFIVAAMSALVGMVGVFPSPKCFKQVHPGHRSELNSLSVVPNQVLRLNPTAVNSELTSSADLITQWPPVAFVCKVVHHVRSKKALNDWQMDRRGEILCSGDKVKTGENSVAIIKFNDKSLVRVREYTELTVAGTTKGSRVSKSINLGKGVVGFSIAKQRSDQEFRFTSPTSIASIRGTEGVFVTTGMADTLTIIEGSVVLTNGVTGENVEVRSGCTGISNHDGTISMWPATPEELLAAGGNSDPSQAVSRKGFFRVSKTGGLYSTEWELYRASILEGAGKAIQAVPIQNVALLIVGAQRRVSLIRSEYKLGIP